MFLKDIWPSKEEIEELVQYQHHAHGRTCRKRNKNECRFNFPQPPMQNTCILCPLEDGIPEKEKENHKQNWEKVKKYLDVKWKKRQKDKD